MAKTNPSSVRFEESDFTFICRREGLKTPQQVVYFLMAEYMKMFKIEKPSIFASASPESFDGKKFNSLTHDESAQGQEPKSNYFTPTPVEVPLTKRQVYINELNECRDYDEIKKVMLRSKGDTLSNVDRQILNVELNNIMEEKGIEPY